MRSIRTKNCKQCGSEFSYETGRGLDRIHCSKLCQGRWHKANKAAKVGNCAVQNCTRKATRADGLCETHWYRVYRFERAKYNPRKPSETFYKRSEGYYAAQLRGHPVADKRGMVYLHRKVLWESIGGGEHQCHWCHAAITWDITRGNGALVVDHVDGNKGNNDLTNLVPSCHTCNAARGGFMRWAQRHKDDPFLLSLFHTATREAA